MALFTGTPIVIRSTTPWFWLSDYGSRSEFSFGGARYVAGASQDLNSAIVAKSTDSGQNWTVFINAETGWSSQFLRMVLDESSSKLIFIGRKSSQLSTFAFDLSAETFNTATALGSNTTSDHELVIRPNGEVFAFYSPTGVSPRPVRYVQITAGTFGSPVTFATNASPLSIYGLQSGSDGTIHVIYRKSGTLYYNTLSPANVIGVEATIDASNGPLLGNILVDEVADQIIAPVAFTANPASFYLGTPISAPVWSNVALRAVDGSLSDNEICCVKDSGVVKFFWQQTDFGAISRIMTAQWNGSAVSGYDTWWDMVANPVPGSEAVAADDRFTDGITAWSNGGLLSVVVTAVIDAALEMSNVYTSLGGSLTGYQNRAY